MNSDKKIRVAMVGSGPRAEAELESMRRSGRAEPVGFWNRTPERAHLLSRENGLEGGYASITEMIQSTSPDVVNIVTHPDARINVMREAIDAGATALLVEKPIALTPAELDLVRGMGDEVFIAVNTQYRWMTHWQEFWGIISSGRIGDITSIHASTAVDLLEQGAHLMSLSLSAARAAGLPSPTWVLAASAGEVSYGGAVGPADISALMDLGDARLHLQAGPSAPRVPGEPVVFFHPQVDIIGTRGRIWVSLTRGWQLWVKDHFSSGTTEWPRDDYQSQADLFSDLADAVRSPSLRESFPTSMARAAEESALLFACIEAGQSSNRLELTRTGRPSAPR